MSPENLFNPVLEKSDVYSFGMTIMVTCVEMKFAFQMLYTPISDNVLLQRARNAIRKNKLLALIYLMINHSPKYRPKLEQITEKLFEILVDNRQVSIFHTFS